MGGIESQEISGVGQTELDKLMESQIWHRPAGSVRGRFRKGPVAFAHISVWEKAVPEHLP